MRWRGGVARLKRAIALRCRMNVNLAYGQGHLSVDLPDHHTTVIEPTHVPGLQNERAAVIAAIENPNDARRHARSRQSPLRRSRRAHCHGLYRAAFLRRV